MEEVIRANRWRVRMFFFWCGIVATLAYRLIVVLNFYSDLLVSVAWYVGTVGFILYFAHRSHVEKKRSDLVKDNDLVEIVSKMKGVSGKQREALNYLVKSAVTSKVRWNSLFIFWLSILALIVGIVLDFLL
jgi:hypothetical protein